MFATIAAIVGTLLGTLVSGLLQRHATRADRADARADLVRSDRMTTITALAHALSDHRRAMWEVRDAQLAGQPADRVTALRDEAHRTRSAITDPAVRVKLLFTDADVRAAAETAIQATYRMRDSTNVDALQADRRTALSKHDAMVDTAARYLQNAL